MESVLPFLKFRNVKYASYQRCTDLSVSLGRAFVFLQKSLILDSFLDGLGYLHVLEMFFVKVGCGIIQKEKSFSLGETLTLPDTLYGFRSVLSGSHT